ncbi:deoxyribose-phosphate aldolase [Oceanotoga sp. DSM 15011]|jgi:deoxyribose-phosphate aldolase|uniref:Deoxyribose-phosphate aldolase n=1 Tax=Oceanotoga teriensis TaxID=515440 RepID=A0AA45C7A8_9BACT|nr:deoxyribose-phosphate aldolase [Oceanotoga teriensis]MDO7976725.1 deoxyribose-phosphate aldolase [Oceanotoga teriensis]PWJ95246.1 deoxyribose-phosphate aldolase [Oceanotoga teriensis]UYP00628.1 deoxyribose-phosphate aldolase [Oceanotoga sp. DSM 15011]
MENKELKEMIDQEIKRVNNDYIMQEKNITIEPKDMAKYIDHTVLKAETTPQDIVKLCKEAKENHFFSVCINPAYVSLAKEELENSEVKIATVIGFPLGANDTTVKAYETQIAREDGADEFDMVINVGMLKNKYYDYVLNDIKSVVEAADGKLVKVIIETCYLTKEEKIAACLLSKLAGAQFVKTSTGFGTNGATKEDVSLMKFVVGDELKVKASGGVRDFDGALTMIKNGAERIGASAGIKIINS